jgi:hypothetical protein
MINVLTVVTLAGKERHCDFTMQIWKRKNEKGWDDIEKPVQQSVRAARDLLCSWYRVNYCWKYTNFRPWICWNKMEKTRCGGSSNST